MNMATILITIMWVYVAVYLVIMVRDTVKHRGEAVKMEKGNFRYNILISFVANFFDTLGIGSFAIATSAWKFKRSMSDDLIPGTLNTAFAIPMCIEATIFMKKVDVAPLTLVLMIGASMVGSVVGARIVSHLDIKKIRFGMGIALLAVAAITLCKINAIGPFGMIGTANGLTGMKLVIGVVASLILGGLMTIGIGFYAPCMALVLLLGMSADMAFPIMMGASAYLCLSSGITFMKEGKYERTSSLPMTIIGCVAVIIAGSIVTSLPLKALTYLVCAVMVICSVTFLKDSRKKKAGMSTQSEELSNQPSADDDKSMHQMAIGAEAVQ